MVLQVFYQDLDTFLIINANLVKEHQAFVSCFIVFAFRWRCLCFGDKLAPSLLMKQAIMNKILQQLVSFVKFD